LAVLLLFLMEEQINNEEIDSTTPKNKGISKIVHAMQEKFRAKRAQIMQIKSFIATGKKRKEELLANLLSE